MAPPGLSRPLSSTRYRKHTRSLPPSFRQPTNVPSTQPAGDSTYSVQRKRATKNEYNTAIGLEYYDIPYIFQVYFFGGRRLRGGQVLDFLAFAPLTIPIQVFGDYWHRSQMSSKDKFLLTTLEHFLKRRVAILWGSETETVTAAKAAVRKKILSGRGY